MTGTLTVEPPGVTFLSVRRNDPGAGSAVGQSTAATFVVDFGAPLTVSAIWFPPPSADSDANTVTAAALWLGTQFVAISPGGPTDRDVSYLIAGFPVDGNNMVSLGEVQTQKLQVKLAQELDPADAQSDALVNLPAAPTSVQISLNGIPAWRSQAGATLLPGTPPRSTSRMRWVPSPRRVLGPSRPRLRCPRRARSSYRHSAWLRRPTCWSFPRCRASRCPRSTWTPHRKAYIS